LEAHARILAKPLRKENSSPQKNLAIRPNLGDFSPTGS
jgi:hypothetical protein